MKIVGTTVLCRKTDITYSEIDNDIVMMDLEQGKFFGLNGVGGSIWTLLENPITLNALCDKLQSEYKVERVECESSVVEFVISLQQANLVELQ